MRQKRNEAEAKKVTLLFKKKVHLRPRFDVFGVPRREHSRMTYEKKCILIFLKAVTRTRAIVWPGVVLVVSIAAGVPFHLKIVVHHGKKTCHSLTLTLLILLILFYWLKFPCKLTLL
jgi:hypothetical protein